MRSADIILHSDWDTSEGERFGGIDGGGEGLSMGYVKSEKSLEVGLEGVEVGES